MLQDVARDHPETDRFCVLLARDSHDAGALAKESKILPVGILGLPGGDDFLFQYQEPVLRAAVTPWVFEYLFALGYDAVLFIEATARIYRPLSEAFRILETTADVVVMPHYITPVRGGCCPYERAVLQTGVFNLGFFAARHSSISLQVMERWQQSLYRYSDQVADGGMSLDQRWCDSLPAMFDRVEILRHRGYGVTPWNIAERALHIDRPDLPMAGEEMLVSFHFSEAVPDHLETFLNSQQVQVSRQVIKQLALEHVRVLREFRVDWYSAQPYDYGIFTDGTRVTAADRCRFRRDELMRRVCAGLPFARPELVKRAGSFSCAG